MKLEVLRIPWANLKPLAQFPFNSRGVGIFVSHHAKYYSGAAFAFYNLNFVNDAPVVFGEALEIVA